MATDELTDVCGHVRSAASPRDRDAIVAMLLVASVAPPIIGGTHTEIGPEFVREVAGVVEAGSLTDRTAREICRSEQIARDQHPHAPEIAIRTGAEMPAENAREVTCRH